MNPGIDVARTAVNRSVAMQLSASLRTDHLALIVLPTEQCNFRCTYCYEDFRIGAMSRETVEAILRMVDRRLPTLKLLSVEWFGGEPTLAMGIVEEVSTHIASAASSAGVRYTASMTTNGSLLDSGLAARLCGLGVTRFQVTVDGPEVLHDRTRVTRSGAGSFRALWKNLLAIRDSVVPVEVLLRVHLTPDNLRSMPRFLAELRETFLHDPRFTASLKPVENLGGPNGGSFAILETATRTAKLGELETVLSAGLERNPLHRSVTVCYAARSNSLVIRADGTLSKCTVALSDPRNSVGRLLPDGSIELNEGRLAPWLGVWDTGDLQALACPYSTFTPMRRLPTAT